MQIKVLTLDVRLSKNTKRAIGWVLLPVAVLAGSMAVAHAYSTSWIVAGQPISAASLSTALNEVQSRLVALETGAKGAAVTAWQSYTPTMEGSTGTAVAAAISTGKYRRVGDSVEVVIKTVFQSAPSGNGQFYQWPIPAGLAIDAAKSNGAPGSAEVGEGLSSGNTNQNVLLEVYVRTSTTVAAQANNVWYVGDSAPFAWAANFEIDLRFSVPIVGWNATQ
jgi:hypothetical protein